MANTEQIIFDILQKHRADYAHSPSDVLVIKCTCGALVPMNGEHAAIAHRRHTATELAKTQVWQNVVVYTQK